MKELIITLIGLLSLPAASFAQDDDIYFMPSKEEIKQVQETRKANITTYYSGISKSDDEYNRHLKKDTLASDIIVFQAGNPKDTVSVKYYIFGDSIVKASDVDYILSKLLSRFDDYYYGWYDPWFYHHYLWGRPWYYGYWGPWYDPWFDPWFYGYYDPYYFGYYSFWGWPYDPWYDPWFCGPIFYRPCQGPVCGRFVVYHQPETPRITSVGANGERNHFSNAYRGNGIENHSYIGQNVMNSVARRHGDATSAMTNRNSIGSRVSSMYGNYSYASRSNSYSHNSYSSSNNSYSAPYSGYSGGGNYGGGHSGGGYSGGGGHGGGGSFGGGRR